MANNIQKQNKKPAKGTDLHHFIATGGKPKDFPCSPALNSTTVTGLKKNKKS